MVTRTPAAFAESTVRAWALMLALLATAALPLLWLVPEVGDEEPEDSLTLFPALLDVMLGGQSSEFAGDPDVTLTGLVTARIGLLVLVVGLSATVVVLIRWLDGEQVGDTPTWLRLGAGWVVVGGGLLMVLGAASVGDADTADGISQGLDTGAGLWAPLVVATLLITPARAPWEG